jgi:hypothetical protein
MKRTIRYLIVTVLGMLTSAATALVLALLDVRVGLAVYSFMLWFVIPLGAVLCGFAGASGYFAGARLLQYKPTGRFVYHVIGVSVATYFLLYYLEYRFTVVDGQPLSQAVQFSTFLFWVLGHQSYTIAPLHRLGSVSIGLLGYAVALFQVIGFAVGGLSVYGYLKTMPFCERCQHYLRETAHIRRIKMYDKDVLIGVYQEALEHLRQRNTSQASEVASAFGETWNSEAIFLLELRLWKCNRCPTESYEIKASERDGKTFKVISGLESTGLFGPGAPAEQMRASA